MGHRFKSFITPVSLLFVTINIPVIMGGLEVWFDWNFVGIVSFIIGFLKVILFLALIKVLIFITNQNEHPLVLAGLVLGVIVMFLNSYYADYQYALYQKLKYGKAVEVKASDLHLKSDLYRTPYVKITNSGLGTKQYFKVDVSLNMFENNIHYCYAPILNTQESIIIINQCGDEKDKTINSLQFLAGKSEIIAELLPKKSRFTKFKALQFYATQKTFENYYKKKIKSFWYFIYAINAIGVLLLFVFIYIKWIN